jgi:hypothetical protein
LDSIWREYLFSEVYLAIVSAVIFSVINLFSLRIRSYAGENRHRLFSLFSGITAAFVFLDLLPSIQQSSQNLIVLSSSDFVTVYEDAIFLVVFLGFLLFFSLECIAISRSQQASENGDKKHDANTTVYFVHFASSIFLQFIISFSLLFEYQHSVVGGVLFTFAVSLHLLASDKALEETYPKLHGRNGRYFATVIPLLGVILSIVFPERMLEASILLAFVSGAILYQSIRSEIPTVNKKSSLALFLVGAVFYAAILITYAVIPALF